MPIALRMNKTTIQTTYNTTSQFVNPQENVRNLKQLIYNWKNNQPLFILTFCLLIIILCTVLNWYFDTYLPRKRMSHEVLVNEEVENNESLDNKTSKISKVRTSCS